MSGVQVGLGAAAARFKRVQLLLHRTVYGLVHCLTAGLQSHLNAGGGLLQVFEDPNKRRNMLIVIGITLGLFVLYLVAQRAQKQ